MADLAQLQQHFADGLLGEPDAIVPQISSRLFPAESVLQVYRNHFILSLGEVLASSYPAVKVMVGDDFFAAAARGFVLAEPLGEGNVMHYGAGFGSWLARLPTTTGLPWLGALADFEWQLERASLLAPEFRCWPAERLASLSVQQWEQLRLLPAADMLLVKSAYPVLALWQMALHGGEAVATLDAPVWLALKRARDGRVVPLSLMADEWALLQGCFEGMPLAALLERDPAVSEHLARVITLGLLVDVEAMP
ncbi:MAG: HvfC/BufC family peptide modification chaperone [Aeromonas sp.]